MELFAINKMIITNAEKLLLENDIIDIEDWIRNALKGKINNCKKRFLEHWRPILFADSTIENVPIDIDAFVALVISRPDYQNRVLRDGL